MTDYMTDYLKERELLLEKVLRAAAVLDAAEKNQTQAHTSWREADQALLDHYKAFPVNQEKGHTDG